MPTWCIQEVRRRRIRATFSCTVTVTVGTFPRQLAMGVEAAARQERGVDVRTIDAFRYTKGPNQRSVDADAKAGLQVAAWERSPVLPYRAAKERG
jgi:hypothetical protein